jgi:GDP-L-fucose synthase
MNKDSRIYIAGGEGMVGTAIGRLLRSQNYSNILNDTVAEPKLSDALELDNFFRFSKPEFVFHVGGASGGIRANRNYPADLMLDNLLGVCNVIQVCHKYKVKKVLCLASSCIYPNHARQPMAPDELMKGTLEPTSAPYATAKLAGMI